MRIQRVIQRDGLSQKEVENRMEKQMEETSKMRLCDFVITNDEQELVIPQVLAIHENLLSKVNIT